MARPDFDWAVDVLVLKIICGYRVKSIERRYLTPMKVKKRWSLRIRVSITVHWDRALEMEYQTSFIGYN